MATDYDIVAGADTGVPILIVPKGGVFLRDTHDFVAGQFIRSLGGYRNNRLYTDELTDEEQALAMKYILLGVPNNG